jgi:hypothetical protein
LLAFEWPEGVTPVLPNVIRITANNEQHMFALKGVIHYADNHFTDHVRLPSGTWFHDGIVTGRSLMLQQLQQHHLDRSVSAIYSQIHVP